MDGQLSIFDFPEWLPDKKPKAKAFGVPQQQFEKSIPCMHLAGFPCTIKAAAEVARSIDADCNGVCCWGCPERCGAQCNASAHRR